MCHELLTQRALFCIGVNAKKGTLSQHFVIHVVPPLSYLQAIHMAVSLDVRLSRMQNIVFRQFWLFLFHTNLN